MSVLVLNAGSSSLKFGLFEGRELQPLAEGMVDWGGRPAKAILRATGAAERTIEIKDANPASAVNALFDLLRDSPDFGAEGVRMIWAVGHRVVHGGVLFRESVRVTREVKEQIWGLSELAPLHNPAALRVILAAESNLPDVPQVAVFDTAFFSSLPPERHVYPLPYQWHADWGIRRFGFHGISLSYCVDRMKTLMPRTRSPLRMIICHLGNGCSATAILDGKPIDTSMGFTPLEGLMMGTRSGSVDPGILLHLLERRGVSIADLSRALQHESGLLGVSGISGDFRKVDEAAKQGHERARLALALYADRIRKTIGSLAASLGGLDSLVFTGGVGENAAGLRAEVCQGLGFMGVELDAEKNASLRADVDVASSSSKARIHLLHTREETLIAREALTVAAR